MTQRLIALTNQKGGSGKTTTAVNLAAALAERKRRVLLVDLDPQCSASIWLGAADAEAGAHQLLTDTGPPAELVQTVGERLGLIPGSRFLVGADRTLAGEVGAETILKGRLEGLGRDWDYILLDCPPALGILTVNALVAAGEVLAPVEAHVLALNGLAQLVQTVDTVQQRLNPGLAWAGILACRVDRRTAHALEVVDRLRDRFNKRVYTTIIRENVRLAEAPSFVQAITVYDTKSAGAADYRALADEVLKQEKGR